MARDRVGQARTEHHEFVLAFGFDGAAGAADGVVEAAELALGAGVHVAHAAHNTVSLIVEIEAV